MTSPYVLATLVFYGVSFVLYVWNLREPSRKVGFGATVFLVGGLILHYVALLERSRWAQTIPYDDLFGSLSLFAWLLAVTYLVIERIHRQRAVGPFVLPIVMGVFLLAYSAFAMSFVLSVIYVVLYRRLRGHKLGIVGWRFPALEVLERMTRSSVLIGCASLVVGMTAGFIWAQRLWGQYWDGDPKVIITVLILFAYLGYVYLSRSPSWRGARASVVCIINFLFVIFSYSIVNLYLSRFHRFF
jgi:ABC-type transport system involved in cytochrome c biogenesis permease subunit